MRSKPMIAILLSVLMMLGSLGQVWASSTQQQITDAQNKQEETQSSLEKTQELIAELEKKKEKSEEYLEELNTQLGKLKEELSTLQSAYDDKQAELDVLQAELAQARINEEEQYEAMKIRIQYMYENSIADAMFSLFSCESIAEFLNQAENISKMTEYDRDMLHTYTETKTYIEEKEEQVQAEKDAIAVLQAECLDRQDAIGELIQATYNQIREYQSDLQAQESAESKLLEQINQQQDEINALLKKAKEEEAARIQAEKKAAAEKAAREAAERAEAARKEAEAAAKAAAEAKAEEERKAAEKAAAEAAAKAEAEREAAEKAEKEKEEKEKEEASKGEYLGRFKLTAYCPCSKCCGKSDGITASGTVATQGRTVAMSGVPFGTKLSVNGKIYIVEDRGTAYGHIDVFMNSHQEALNFGVQYADVYQLN